MKQFVLSIAIISLAYSCNKKETPAHIEVDTKDSTMAVATTPELKEISKAELSAMLKPQNNDTVYVTNFFATWCGPCMAEIPHFKEKLEELKKRPVKFTFVSLDQKKDWDTKVKDFGIENGLSSNIVLFDGQQLDPPFFAEHFKTWKGEGIPFTLIQKGTNSDETEGSMSKEELSSKINSFLEK